MTDSKRFAWIDFYSELAGKLIPYSENHAGLVEKIKTIFQKIGLNLPKLEKDGNVFDIDPFTTFGLFNKGITTENRIKIITAFSEEFSVSAPIPTEFDGIPVLNNQKATFYWFQGGRKEHDIDNLWAVFKSALDYADTHSLEARQKLIQSYDAALQQKGVKWNLTMGLFWVRPLEYINLDAKNRWFISQPEFMPESFVDSLPMRYKGDAGDYVPTGTDYLKICDSCKTQIQLGPYNYKSLPELSAEAWVAVTKNDKKAKTAEEQESGFKKWMSTQLSAAGTPMVSGSIANNAIALRKICSEMRLEEFPEITNLFSVTDIDLFFRIRDAIMNHEDYEALNKKHGNGYLNSALTIWYEKYLRWIADGGDPDSIDEENSTNALADDNSNDIHFWMYTVFNDDSWRECQEKGLMVIGCDDIGDYKQYTSKEELRQALIEAYEGESSRRNQALMTWNFSRVIKPNDVVFAKRANTLVGKGIVTGEYVFDPARPQYKNVRSVKWQQIGEWEHPGNAVAKRLTDISPYIDYVEKLNAIFSSESLDEDEDLPEIIYPSYSADDFLSEVFMTKSDYEILTSVLLSKKNIILQGAPGVGKTFAAKRLAYSIMGEKNKERVMMVQFHQSYSYEDFIMGFRPSSTGFELRKGVFYNFCKKAEEDSENAYFFIIDEINRGNLSKIFGELFMLIETDKRGIELQLLYSDEKFSVPQNIYIIGMMNTADRSLAMLDYALRRRFSFIDLKPGLETEGFLAYQKHLSSDKFDRLITCIKNLNSVIATDEALGEGFCIGHSYFCNLDEETVTEQALYAIVEFEIIPLLKEYWFDEPSKVRDWSNNLRSAIK